MFLSDLTVIGLYISERLFFEPKSVCVTAEGHVCTSDISERGGTDESIRTNKIRTTFRDRKSVV